MNIRRNSAVFIHIFGISSNFSSVLLIYVQIVNCIVIFFISQDRGGLLNCSIRVLWLAFMLKFSKFRHFLSIMRTKFSFFSPLSVNLLEVDTLELRKFSP